MNAITKLSTKGQVVIPKDVRDALGWTEGVSLSVRSVAGRAILEPVEQNRNTITYEEFRRRVPKHDGPPVAIEDMNSAIEQMFRDKYRDRDEA